MRVKASIPNQKNPPCSICGEKAPAMFLDHELFYEGSSGFICFICKPFVDAAEEILQAMGFRKPTVKTPNQ